MRDIHCHILPGVDDGAADLEESLAMLEAAKRAGVTRIVCTPHCRDPYFDYDKMWDAFELLRDNADGFPLQMGLVSMPRITCISMGPTSFCSSFRLMPMRMRLESTRTRFTICSAVATR